MKKTYILILWCVVSAAVFVSCTLLATQQQPTLPEVIHQGSTLEADPTYLALYAGTDQINDGKLSLTIEDVGEGCHDKTMPISIRLIFRNLTRKPLILWQYFEIARGQYGYDDEGNISAQIQTMDQEAVVSWLNWGWYGDAWPPRTPSIITIPGRGSYKTIVDYDFPERVVDETAIPTLSFVTPTPGRYYLRFVYRGTDVWSMKLWTGEIASKQIEICVK